MRLLGRPKKADNRDTKQAILDAALDLFAEKGFPDTSIRAIAKAVGVSEAAIYSHFQSKQDILDTLYDEHGPKRVVRIFESIDKDLLLKNPRGYLTDRLLEVFGTDDRNEDGRGIKVYKIHQTELFRTNGIHSCILKDRRDQAEEAILSVIRILINSGKVKVKLKDAKILGVQLLAPILLIRFDQFAEKFGEEQSKAEFFREHLRVYFDLILEEPKT